jgi:DUF4097 and DUF4098 domain-containing protein YvlB
LKKHAHKAKKKFKTQRKSLNPSGGIVLNGNVEYLTVNGNVEYLTVNGNVEYLTVNGNVEYLTVNGNVEYLTVGIVWEFIG